MGLSIVIVGAGIGGLAAATALRRIGHNVQIVEQSRFKEEIGAAIVVTATAAHILRGYGFDFAKARMVRGKGITTRSGETLAELGRMDYEPTQEWYYSHRVDLHAGLRHLATSSEGLGTPATIRLGAKAVDYDAEQGSVTLANGETLTADLIVAADGVHTLAHYHIQPSIPPPLTKPGNAVVRFLLPTHTLLADPATAPLLAEDARMTPHLLHSPDRTRILLRVPVRNGTLQHFSTICLQSPDRLARQAAEFTVDAASLARELEGFHPAVLAMTRKPDIKILQLWPCTEREPLDHLTRGRLVLLGDAAHPMQPLQGHGATQAIDDAAALGVLLNCAAGDVGARLELYERLRLPRTAVLRVVSAIAFGALLPEQVRALEVVCEKYMPGEALPASVPELMRFGFGYDVVGACEAALTAVG